MKFKKPKRSIWLGIGGIAVAGSLLALAIIPRDPLRPETVADIRLGMTESEVESVLGRAADYEYDPGDIVGSMPPVAGTDPVWERVWIGPRGAVIVHFDARGVVCGRGFLDAADSIFHTERPPSIGQRARKLLGL